MRNSFVFYRSFNEAMAELSERDQLTLYRAIVGYGLDGQEASFDSSCRARFISYLCIIKRHNGVLKHNLRVHLP